MVRTLPVSGKDYALETLNLTTELPRPPHHVYVITRAEWENRR